MNATRIPSLFALTLVAALSLAAPLARAQTTLTAGDLAIIGVTYDSTPFMVSVVALRDIAAGTVIRISDYSYDPSTAEVSAVSLANLNEGSITWTTGAIAAGSVFRFSISCPVTGVPTVTMLPVNGSFTVNGWTSTAGPASCPSPAGGDNWFIYQGGTASSFSGATFIYAWTNTFGVNYFSVDYPRGTFLTNPPHTATNVSIGLTFLPPSLTNNTNAIALNRDPNDVTSPGYHGDNSVYNGPTYSGTKAQLLTAISTIANWATSETTVYDISSGGAKFPGAVPFTVTVPDTTPPTVVSILRRLPSTTQATTSTSATFRVTFSEAVNAPTTANFAVAAVNSSTITGTIASVTAVSTSIYDVAVTITGGTGEFRLKVID
jgi:hypothetical protein